MQSLKKIIYKVPIIDKLIKKWEKCNNEITKLRSENKELKACIQKMSFEVRRNEVFREIDNIHFRKVQRDMEAKREKITRQEAMEKLLAQRESEKTI